MTSLQSNTPFADTSAASSSANEFLGILTNLAKARGSGLYEAREGQQALVRRAISGQRPPELSELSRDEFDRLQSRQDWATLALHSGDSISAALIFVFATEAEREAAQSILRRIVPLFESLTRFVGEQARQIELVREIGKLESAIAAEKILDRARGLMREHPYFNEETIALVDRHAARVLASCQFSQTLQERLRDLEATAAAREVTSHAKALLQEQFGYTEEKAYLHIRSLSRQSRKRMPEIAREILSRKHDRSAAPEQFAHA